MRVHDRRRSEWVDSLFLEHYARLKKLAYYKGRGCGVTDPESWAEDMVQETFLRLTVKADQLDDHPNILGWLIETMKNVMLNELNRMSSGEVPVAEVWEHSAEPSYEMATESAEISFPPGLTRDERELLYRRYGREESHKEIALALGISPATCRMRLHRAEQKYKRLIKKSEHSTPFDGFRPNVDATVQEGGASHV